MLVDQCLEPSTDCSKPEDRSIKLYSLYGISPQRWCFKLTTQNTKSALANQLGGCQNYGRFGYISR